MAGRGRTAPKIVFAALRPLDRVQVPFHRSSDDHPPANMGEYGPYNADSQSQVLDICNDLENGVKPPPPVAENYALVPR
jgi:hypothetical protein